MLVLVPFQLLVFWQDKKILEEQNQSIGCYPDFKPMVRTTDIMRKYIEKTFDGDIQACEIRKKILL
jgi:hypothetical protein